LCVQHYNFSFILANIISQYNQAIISFYNDNYSIAIIVW